MCNVIKVPSLFFSPFPLINVGPTVREHSPSSKTPNDPSQRPNLFSFFSLLSSSSSLLSLSFLFFDHLFSLSLIRRFPFRALSKTPLCAHTHTSLSLYNSPPKRKKGGKKGGEKNKSFDRFRRPGSPPTRDRTGRTALSLSSTYGVFSPPPLLLLPPISSHGVILLKISSWGVYLSYFSSCRRHYVLIPP